MAETSRPVCPNGRYSTGRSPHWSVSGGVRKLTLVSPQGPRVVRRYAEIYARYEPVFNVYQTAARSDDVLAVDALRTGEQMVARIEAHMMAPTLPRRPRDPVIRLALECLAHVLDIGGILRSVTPRAYPSERVEAAPTDVLH